MRSAALVLLAAAPAAAALAADGVHVEAERVGDSVEVRAHALLAAPAALVWQVLTDYERLPGFIPGIAKSVVRGRHGNELTLEQTGEARFLVFSFPIEVTYEVVESPPASVASHAIAGNLKRMNGRYDIQTQAQGEAASGHSLVLLRYSGVIEPDFNLPPLVGTAALRGMADEQFTAMVAEIERRAAAAAPGK
jgi:ribosome-associated toxin RatA of RatAB toxin-antitoxin module